MIADTTFLIDLLRGKKEAISLLQTIDGDIKTTTLNEYEVNVGITRLTGIDTEKKVRETKTFFERFDILNLDESSVVESAKICGRLLQKGTEIGDHDCLIAGIALQHGINTIITSNKKRFERIPGITVMSYG